MGIYLFENADAPEKQEYELSDYQSTK